MSDGNESLTRQSQEALITLINVDIDLCHTMLGTAGLASARDHYEQARDNAWNALMTIRKFMDRIEDRSLMSELHSRVNQLQAEFESLPPFQTKDSL